MVKISMALPEADLALIDQFSGGNRTAFMVGAAVARAKALRRERIDAEIIAGMNVNAEADYAEYKVWECTINDGLEDVD